MSRLRRLAVVVLVVANLALPAAGAQPVLFVANVGNNTVGEYNALTGATINSAVVNGQGLNDPVGIALDSNGHFFVTNSNNNTVGQYDATTGATVNPEFINVFGPLGLRLGGANHLFVVGRAVGEYNAATGATINSSFISGSQLGIPVDIALDAHNHIFLTNGSGGAVGEYDATTGATINASFITGLNQPGGIALDALGHLFVAQAPFDGGNVSECDANTGAIINANFITDANGPTFLALDNANHLFVSNADNNTIGEYDATTGATINAAFINGQGLNSPDGLVFAASVPEPGGLALVGVAATGLVVYFRRRLRWAFK